MPHQSLSAVLDAFVLLFDRLPVELTHRVEDTVLRILPSLGDYVLTKELDRALSSLTATLTTAGRVETAAALDRAHREFAQTVGRLGSRSTRGGAE